MENVEDPEEAKRIFAELLTCMKDYRAERPKPTNTADTDATESTPRDEPRRADGAGEAPTVKRCHYVDVRGNPDYQWSGNGWQRPRGWVEVKPEVDGPLMGRAKRKHVTTHQVEHKHRHRQ